MKKPVILVGLGMVLAFVIMAGIVGFSNLVFADRGVVLVNNSDIDVSLSVLENAPEGRTPTPVRAVTGDAQNARPRATATPHTPQPVTTGATPAPITPTRLTAQAPDQPREDGGTESEDAEHVIDRRDESYRAQLLRAYDMVATVRPRVNRPIRRRVASPTPANLVGPAPTQDANATPVVITTATLAPLPDANTPQPPAQPNKPEPSQPQPPAPPTQPPAQPQPQPQPPAPKPTEDHDDDHDDDDHGEDHKPEPTKAPEPTETHH